MRLATSATAANGIRGRARERSESMGATPVIFARASTLMTMAIAPPVAEPTKAVVIPCFSVGPEDAPRLGTKHHAHANFPPPHRDDKHDGSA